MNRLDNVINKALRLNKKSVSVYMTSGLPDMNSTKEFIKAGEKIGIEIFEIGIPFSDPIADDGVLQTAANIAIQNGATLKSSMEMVKALREEGFDKSVIFVMYYNTVMSLGEEEFVRKAKECGIDGVFIHDLPYEEQNALKNAIEHNDSELIILQQISYNSHGRNKKILNDAKGLIYCAKGVTTEFISDCNLPYMVDCDMEDGVKDVEESIKDGALVYRITSSLVKLYCESGYDIDSTIKKLEALISDISAC